MQERKRLLQCFHTMLLFSSNGFNEFPLFKVFRLVHPLYGKHIVVIVGCESVTDMASYMYIKNQSE